MNVTSQVREAVRRALESQPEVRRWDLAERVRRELDVPISTVVAQIRALEREGAPTPGSREPASTTNPERHGSGQRQTDEADVAERIAGRRDRALLAYMPARHDAVHAYCALVCSPDAVDEAVQAAFGRFSHEIQDDAATEDAGLDETLLRSTRTAAAERPASPLAAGGPRGWLRRYTPGVREGICGSMPRLLAARANRVLTRGDLERVERHLSRCEPCRATETARRAGDAAFAERAAEPSVETIRSDVLRAISQRAAAP